MKVERFISVIQRRQVGMDDSVAHLLPILEPLFLIDTHMSFDERIWLFTLVSSLSEGFVACEIGSYVGASTAFMAAAASMKRGHVHAVDTWRNDAMGAEPVEDTFERFLENTKRFRHAITTHRGRAEDMKEQVPAVDVLFIDGDHSYEGVHRNLADFAPKIKPGGMLILHDFVREGVRRAVAEYFRQDQLVPVVLVESLQAFRLK